MTREHVNMERLQSETNETFLLSAAQLIGSTFLFRGPKNEARAERKKTLKSSLQRAKTKILALRALGLDLSHYTERSHLLPKYEDDNDASYPRRGSKLGTSFSGHLIPPSWFDQWTTCKTFVATTLKKFRGAGVSPPPPASLQEAAWTLLGTSLTMMLVTNLNLYFQSTYGVDHTFALP